jgi:Drexlerviridae HNH endonuclease
MTEPFHPLSKLQLKLMEILDYDPEVGEMTWKGGRRQERLAGCVDRDTGYIKIRIGGRSGPLRYVHHVIWAYMTGAYPNDKYYIDHKDHVRTNNKWDNLRLLTPSDSLRHGRYKQDI